jgi:hypothetical protein
MRQTLPARFGRLVLGAALVNLIGAQIFHEAGHWLVATIGRHRPVWGISSLVQLGDRTPLDPDAWSLYQDPLGGSGWLRMESLPGSDAEWAVFFLAGPLFQLIAIGIGLWLARHATTPRLRTIGLLLSLVNGLGLAMYQILSSIGGGGSDEVLLGEYTGAPWLVFSVGFGLAAVAGFIAALRLVPNTERRPWAGAVVIGALLTGPLFAQLQRLINEGVDRGDAVFTSVMGFALPVILLATAGAVGLWLVMRSWPETVSS